MNENSVKSAVVENYSKLARGTKNGLFSKLFVCCDSKSATTQVGRAIGYTEQQLTSTPENSNMGVGCGNPSQFADIKEGETVIDLGSGAGFDAFIIAPLVGPTGKSIGVDLSSDMITLAEQNAEKGDYANVSFVEGDIEKLPFEDHTADLVVSNCVINLSQDKSSVFKEAFRVLKPGGRISISDIVLAKTLPDFVKDSLVAHIACVSGAENLPDYLRYIEEAGFSDLRIESEKEFPIELILSDPQVNKIAAELDFNLQIAQAKEMSSFVKSISFTARKS